MKKLCKEKDCTACMACYNVCSLKAIEIIENELGEVHPRIIEDKCVNCGKCEKVCPILHPVIKNSATKAIALYTKNEQDRKTCASGGVATTLSRKIIEQGGVVFGTGFDLQGMPIYKKATAMEELEEFKGSKYVYCFPNFIFREVEKELKNEKVCLFVGTPCHVAGLKSYLGKAYEKLLTVDLICHGTPPYRYLKEHIESLHLKSQPQSISFRGKKDYYLTVYDKREKVIYSKKADEDIYFYPFMGGVTIRECCTRCQYGTKERVSDITIGDFWGLGEDALQGYKGKKSVSLLNTEKGKAFFAQVKDCFVSEIRELDEAQKGNPKLRGEISHNKEKAFKEMYIKHQNFVLATSDANIKKQVKINRVKNKILILPRFIKYKILKK